MAERPGIMIYFDILTQLDLFSNDEIGQIFKAMLNYSYYGEIPSFQDRAMKTLWSSIKDKLDRDNAAYSKKCEQNRSNALKRSKSEQQPQATASERCQLQQELEPEPELEPETESINPNTTIKNHIKHENQKEIQGERELGEGGKQERTEDTGRSSEDMKKFNMARLEAEMRKYAY